jgi:hypothetical protein
VSQKVTNRSVVGDHDDLMTDCLAELVGSAGSAGIDHNSLAGLDVDRLHRARLGWYQAVADPDFLLVDDDHPIGSMLFSGPVEPAQRLDTFVGVGVDQVDAAVCVRVGAAVRRIAVCLRQGVNIRVVEADIERGDRPDVDGRRHRESLIGDGSRTRRHDEARCNNARQASQQLNLIMH